MTKRAEMETRLTGTEVGIRGLGGLESAFVDLGKTAQRVGALMRDMHKEWTKPTAVSTAIVKLGAQVLGQQVRDAAEAVAAPAKTSYAQALAKAVEYRDATQRIATSTGKSYEATGEQILGTAQRLGLLPSRVQDYARSVRQLTGDWGGAMSGLDAYQNRALKTDRTLEEMIPTAATLATTFGIKATDDVNRFFGTLDRQAKSAGLSAEVAERAFMAASGSLAALTNARPQQLSALTTAVMAGAPTPEMGMSRIGAVGGLLQGHMRYIEARMRKSGKLAKGEHLYDEQGQLRGDKMFDALEFLQGDMSKFYGSKDKKELIGRISQSGMMSMQDAAGLMNLDVAKLRKDSQLGGSATDVTSGFLGTSAGKRTLAETRKEVKDLGLGATLLPAQDAAVSVGGGAAGVALASAGAVFDKAATTFFDAVEIFVGKAGGAAAGGGAGAGAGGGAAAGLAARVGVGSLAAGAAVAGVGAATYALHSDEMNQISSSQQNTFADMRAGKLPELQQKSLSRRAWMRSHHLGFLLPDTDEDLTGAGTAAASAPGRAPAPGGLMLSAQELGAAVAKALAGQTLRVQSVVPASPPPGQPQPP